MAPIVDPYDLVTSAYAAGFQVVARPFPFRGGETLVVLLTKDLDPSGARFQVITDQAQQILRGVKRSSWTGTGIASIQVRRTDNGVEVEQVQTTVRDVDPHYFHAVGLLTTQGDPRSLRSAFADQEFDRKVEDEVASDTLVLTLEARVSQAERRLSEEQAALEARRTELRVERQGLREPYKYLTDDQEL